VALKHYSPFGRTSKKQIEELKKFKSLVLALDNDEGGRKQKAKLTKNYIPMLTFGNFPSKKK